MSAFGNKIRQELRSNRIRDCIILILLVGMVLEGMYYASLLHSQSKICVINEHTQFVGTADPVMMATETHAEMAKMAATAIFSRNPKGFQLEETLKRIVNTEILNRVKDEMHRDATAFASRSITQNLEISKVKEEVLNNTTVKMLIDGDLVTNQILEGRPDSSSKRIRVLMLLTENDQWLDNHKYIMVATGLQVSYL